MPTKYKFTLADGWQKHRLGKSKPIRDKCIVMPTVYSPLSALQPVRTLNKARVFKFR